VSPKQPCSQCGNKAPFDPELAYRRLARKHLALAELVRKQISQTSGTRELAPLHTAALLDELARIVGGEPAGAEEFPECCLVGRQNPNNSMDWFCTGTLIHPRVVISAGHCVIQSRLANIVALRASNENALAHADLVPVRGITAHPLYVQTHQVHDLSVMILRRPSEVTPVALASAAEINSAQKVTLAGFGNDDVKSTRGFGVKRKVTVDLRAIRRSSADDLAAQEHQFGFDADLEFVAGGSGFDSCNGDSGGPAYIDVAGTLKVAGATSRGIEGTQDPCGDGGIYSRVDANLDFIRQTATASGIDL